MSTTREEAFKRWTAKRKAQLVLVVLQGRTTVAEASRADDLPPSDIEEWVRRLARQVDNLKVEISALTILGRYASGVFSPRDS